MRKLFLLLLGVTVISCSSENKGDKGYLPTKKVVRVDTEKVKPLSTENEHNEVVHIQSQDGLPVIHYRNDYAKAPKWITGSENEVINVININGNTLKTYIWFEGRGWRRLRD